MSTKLLEEKVRIVTVDNPFNKSKKKIEDVALTISKPMKELIKEYPENYTIILNGKKIDREAFKDVRVIQGDIISIMHNVHGPDTDVGGKAIGILTMVASFAVFGALGGGIWGSLGAAGVSFLGGYVVSLFTPPLKDNTTTDDKTSAQNYSWGQPKPNLLQGMPVPITFGRVRIKSPQVLSAYATGDGANQFLNMILSGGEGELDTISDITINENPIDNYNDVVFETRLGTNDQPGISIPALSDTLSDVPLAFTLSTSFSTSITNTNATRAIEISLNFPNGLFTIRVDNGWRYKVRMRFIIEYKKVGAGIWTETTETVEGSALGGPVRRTIRIEGLDKDQYDVRIKKDPAVDGTEAFWNVRPIAAEAQTADAYAGTAFMEPWNWRWKTRDFLDNDYERNFNWGDTAIWDRLTAVTSDNPIRPGKALLAVRIKATDQLSGSMPAISWTQERANVWVWDPVGEEYVEKSASNPWWAAYDLIHYARRWKNVNTAEFEIVSYGAPKESMIYEEFKECADYADSQGFTFNYILDSGDQLFDALRTFQDVGRGCILLKGTRFGVTCDMPKPPSQMFTMGNMVKGSFKESFASLNDRANSVEITYTDKNKNWDQINFPVYNIDWDDSAISRNPTQLKFDPITNYDQAYKQGKYYLRSNALIIRSCSFEVDVDAIASDVGDVILIQHDIPQWGFGGRILEQVNGKAIRIDQEVNFSPGQNYSITIRHSETDDLVTYRAWRRGSGFTDIIGLDPPLQADIVPYDDVYSFGATNIETKPFTITSITRTLDQRRKITCVEYNEALFTEETDIPVVNYSALTLSAEVEKVEGRSSLRRINDGSILSDIMVNWIFPRDSQDRISAFLVYFSTDDGNTFNFIARTTDLSIQLTDMKNGDYFIKVRTQNSLGQISDGAVSQKIIVSNIVEIPPDPDGMLVERLIDGSWKFSVVFDGDLPADFDGWSFRIRAGSRIFWGDAIPVNFTPISQNVYQIQNLPEGTNTIMVKMKNKGGYESINEAFVIKDLGDDTIANVVDTEDQHPTFAGSKTNCTVVGNELLADVLGASLFWGYQPQAFWDESDAILFWDRDTHAEMEYEFTISPGIAGTLHLVWDIEGIYQVFIRKDTAPVSAYGRYTGPFDIGASDDYDIKIVILEGFNRGTIVEFTTIVDMPDLVENAPDEVIDSAGTRVATTKNFTAITSIQMALQSHGSYPARIILFSDRNNPSGPLFQGYDEDGVAQDALVDITFIGY